jgi:hypothetical protein
MRAFLLVHLRPAIIGGLKNESPNKFWVSEVSPLHGLIQVFIF